MVKAKFRRSLLSYWLVCGTASPMLVPKGMEVSKDVKIF